MTPQKVLEFWLDEVGPKGWYNSTEALDAEIRDKFFDIWTEAAEGAYGLWLTYPTGALGYIVLMDQLPRNMFRDDAQAFATDFPARAAAKVAIDHGWDLKIHEPARQFFYLPLMHSESLCDQDRCVRLMHERLPDTGESNLLHAKVHREIIRKFGRFPYRNKALGRSSTAADETFLAAGGYGEILRELQEKQQLEAVG
jgi:uncharacterized protein (DUF924 family)